MRDYLSGRYFSKSAGNKDHTKSWSNIRLDAIASNFGLPWLEQQKGHPLQELWARKDALATWELLSLGDAIYNFLQTNPHWAVKLIKQIKTAKAGNCYGAIFELLGLNLFCCGNQQVIGAPENNPGYDGTVVLADGSLNLISLKNHGISSHERYFKEHAMRIDRRFRHILRSRLLNGIEFYVTGTKYPSTKDWQALKEALDPLINRVIKHFGFRTDLDLDTSIVATIWDEWRVKIRLTPSKYKPLSPWHLSAAFQVTAPYHQNEQANFLENIRKACSNLTKHTANAPEGVARSLLIRLSASASVNTCIEWIHDYFAEYPEEPIELIFLYQADVAIDVGKKRLVLTHFLEMLESPKGKKWATAGPTDKVHYVNVVPGRWVDEPSERCCRHPLTDEIIPFERDVYLYQTCDIYRWYRKIEGPIEVISPATGTKIYAVIGDGADNKLQLASVIAPPQHELVLLP